MKEFNPQIQRITGVNGIKRVYLPIGLYANKGGTAESFGPLGIEGLFLLNKIPYSTKSLIKLLLIRRDDDGTGKKVS